MKKNKIKKSEKKNIKLNSIGWKEFHIIKSNYTLIIGFNSMDYYGLLIMDLDGLFWLIGFNLFSSL